jgi:hypothetical protein
MRFVKLISFFDLVLANPVAAMQMKEIGLISDNQLRDAIQNRGTATGLFRMVTINLGDDLCQMQQIELNGSFRFRGGN